MSIKAVVFDKDGTLMKYDEFWIPVAEHAAKTVLENVGASPDYTRLLLDSIGAYDGIGGVLCYGTYKDMAECFFEAVNKIGIKCDGQEMYNLTVTAFRESMSFGKIKPVCTNLREVINSLKESGMIIGLVTSDDMYGTKKSLEFLRIYDLFDEICVFDGVHPVKPNPYYMELMCKKYKLSPNEIIMVGDTLNDVKFAENSGTEFAAVADKQKDREILKIHTEIIFDNVSQLPEYLKKYQKI